jgi:hypothetical protein
VRSWSFVVAFLLVPAASRAQDFVGTRALSMGEAYRAVATGNDAIYMNPAGLVLVPRYSPEVHYLFNLVDEAQEFDGSIVDSKTSAFAAGLAYTFQGREFTRRTVLEHAATLAVAYAIFPRVFQVGLGLKYVNVTDAIVGNYLNALTADLGLLATLPGGVNLAAVGYNLIPFGSSHVPVSAAFAASWDLGPLSALAFGGVPAVGMIPNAAGTAVPGDMSTLRGPLSGLTIASDVYIDFFTLRGPMTRASAGVEYLLLDFVPLRAGYMYEQTIDEHSVSVGAGFIVPYFGLDVGYRESIARGQKLEILDNPLGVSRTFSLSLKFFIELPS